MEDTKAFVLKYGKKNSWFDYYRRFLDMDHTYMCNRYRFRKNIIESEKALVRLTGQQVGIGLGNFQRLQKLGNPLDCLAMR